MITSTVSLQDMTLMDPVTEVFRQEDVLERIFRLLVDPADVGRARVRPCGDTVLEECDADWTQGISSPDCRWLCEA